MERCSANWQKRFLLNWAYSTHFISKWLFFEPLTKTGHPNSRQNKFASKQTIGLPNIFTTCRVPWVWGLFVGKLIRPSSGESVCSATTPFPFVLRPPGEGIVVIVVVVPGTWRLGWWMATATLYWRLLAPLGLSANGSVKSFCKSTWTTVRCDGFLKTRCYRKRENVLLWFVTMDFLQHLGARKKKYVERWNGFDFDKDTVINVGDVEQKTTLPLIGHYLQMVRLYLQFWSVATVVQWGCTELKLQALAKWRRVLRRW